MSIQSRVGSNAREVEVWIDTGFTGDLVIPRSSIDELGLQQSGSVDAVLADGSQTELQTYSCVIEWFGKARNLEVIANDGEYPLLGVGLLLGLELRVDYRNLKLMLEPTPKQTT
ncbi:MAG: clan AA aspartic protease [Planctomycetota bacterium]